jgi:hypothetical protein
MYFCWYFKILNVCSSDHNELVHSKKIIIIILKTPFEVRKRDLIGRKDKRDFLNDLLLNWKSVIVHFE